MGSCNGEETVHGEVRLLRGAAAIVDGLNNGRDCAVQLKILIENSVGIDPVARELVEEVMSSFTAAISDLSSGDVAETKQEYCNLTAAAVGSPAGSDNLGGEYNSDSLMRKRKVLSASTVVKDRRGGSRRRRSNAYECKKVFAKTTDDGFTWRKYGQKEIFSSKHPRSYFRCTHKYDRGCQATKQVQKSEDDSSLFVITYMGEHTCKNNTNNKLNSPFSNPRGPCVISFGSAEGMPDSTIINSSSPFSDAEKQETIDYQEAVSSSARSTTVSSELFIPVIDQFVGLPEEVSSLPASMDSLDMGFMDDLNFDDYLLHYHDGLQ